ncbi:PDT-domain-containing protein [Decorospora gaudefroyi]|uniref:prephenate dehydratase n=1 Tax=Decorospora gaudefroyi TaxID=184978 RepID=A0A6A5KYU3_9PLEO|nr:PDT-domain-containing protein [Decorospora gaudefroyi]
MAEKERPVVAFLGPEGSYTHQFLNLPIQLIVPNSSLLISNSDSYTPQATLDAFKFTSITLSPQITIEDVFSTVQSGTAYRGVVPFENSSNGSVVFTLDLFADIHKKYADILVCGEAYVSVKHCLLGYAQPSSRNQAQAETESPSANEGEPANDFTHIKRIYSHPQAWGQCKTFLSTHLKYTDRHDVSSTSKAAEIASQDETGSSAALSSIMAADMFGLDVLAKTINDNVDNTTRFLVLRRADSPTSASISQSDCSKEQAAWKSLVTFTVDHGNPGALARCLDVFGTYGINLTSINTRPSGLQNWNYVFFVEFQGRKEDGHGAEEGSVNKALGELGQRCRTWRWLGSWRSGEVIE